MGYQSDQEFGQGRFTLRRELGRGGMGVVWLAFDRHLDEEVALKFLPPELTPDREAIDSLRREVSKSRKLSHPNIVRIHDLILMDGEPPFLSMEYIEGSNLASLRSAQPDRLFGWDAIKPVLEQLCAALDYAHQEKVAHRDLKPGNMMLDGNGRLKLADFGLAATLTESISKMTRDLGVSGTMAYMSPQQLDGRIPNAADDIYALGATMYELLTSKPPFFSGDLPHQIRNLVPQPMEDRLQELELANDIPADVAALTMACLAKERESRPASAREVADWIGLNTSEFVSDAVTPVAGAADVAASGPSSMAETVAEDAASESVELESSEQKGKAPQGIIFGIVGALLVTVLIFLFNKGEDESEGEVSPDSPEAGHILDLLPAGDLSAFETFMKDEGAPATGGDVFKLSGGELEISGAQSGFLATRRSFTNYHLTLEYQWLTDAPDRDSGISITTEKSGRGFTGLECDLVGPQHGLSGQLQLYGKGELRVQHADQTLQKSGVVESRRPGAPEKPPGEWNTLEILSDEHEMQIAINGFETVRVGWTAPADGPIMFQSRSGAIRFRNVRVADYTLGLARAHELMKADKWAQAAGEFELFLKNNPDALTTKRGLWLGLLCASIWNDPGVREAHKKHSRSFFDRFANPQGMFEGLRPAQAYVAFPGANDPDLLARALKGCVHANSIKPDIDEISMLRAKIEYRKGNYSEVARWLEKPLKSKHANRRSNAFAFEAMTRFQLGDKSGARTLLGKARAEQSTVDRSDFNQHHLAAIVAMNEATALIETPATGVSQ